MSKNRDKSNIQQANETNKKVLSRINDAESHSQLEEVSKDISNGILSDSSNSGTFKNSKLLNRNKKKKPSLDLFEKAANSLKSTINDAKRFKTKHCHSCYKEYTDQCKKFDHIENETSNNEEKLKKSDFTKKTRSEFRRRSLKRNIKVKSSLTNLIGAKHERCVTFFWNKKIRDFLTNSTLWFNDTNESNSGFEGDEVSGSFQRSVPPQRRTRKSRNCSVRCYSCQLQYEKRMVLEPKFADYGSILHSASSAAAGGNAIGDPQQQHPHLGTPSTTTTSSSSASFLAAHSPTGGATTNHRQYQHTSAHAPHQQPTLYLQQQGIINISAPAHHYKQHLNACAGSGAPVDSGGSANINGASHHIRNMTQEDDMYQRKPLLPVAGKPESLWDSPTSMPSYYGEEDEENVLQSKSSDSSNGIIKITMPAPVREEPRFPQERWKTLLAAIILFFNFVLVLTSLALVHERVPDRSTYGPLPDIFHDGVPAQDWALDVSEYLLIICFNSAIVAVLLHKHRFIVARRAFLIMSLLYMYRSVTMYVTAMPISSTTYYCSPKSNHTSPVEVVKRIVQLAAGMGLSINGKHTYCGDYIYSGHTVILVFSYLIISEYTPKKVYIIHWAYGLAALTGVFMLMVAHGHYSVDVIIAYYVTTRLFWMYHTLANNQILKQHSSSNLLGRVWWFRIFLYFEANIGGTVPRQWPDWPFPRPRRLHAKSRES